MSTLEWQIGDRVWVRGRSWNIRGAERWPDCTLLRLTGLDSPDLSRGLLTPCDRPTRLGQALGARAVRRRRWLHEVRRLGADLAPYGGALATAATSARLLAYQIEPLLAVLRHGATRLLIADEVGLGKTVQAGLILLELARRVDEFRAIVLVPAGLREQWRDELHARLGLVASESDAAWLRAAAAGCPADVNPWSLPGIHLVSIDFAKRAEVLRALEDITWDVAVVDEAHLASASSDRRSAAHAVASRSRRTVLLTATPDMGDAAAFAALCGIGAIDAAEPPVLLFRRTRAGAIGTRPRRSLLLRVQPTPAEQRMHELLERYTRRVWDEAARRGDPRARLAAIVLRKRALSSAASLAVSVQRRLELLAGAIAEPGQQLPLPLADEDPLGDGVDDQEIAAPGLADVRSERRWLAAIAEAARLASRAESKSARLLRWLARTREPAIVFTEYRDTLHRLERLLRATGRQWIAMHGGLERAERSRVQAAFNAGGRSLIATDAAAEGLNLHHYCRIVVHYELPWRPARIEQRVGRVDRLGQNRPVHEIALIAAGTAERLVLAPLVARTARARAAGDASAGLLDALSESAVAELVMGARPPAALAALPAPGPPPFTRSADLRAEAAAEVSRLETSRRWLAASPATAGRARGSAATLVATTRSASSVLEPGVVLVFTQLVTDADGRHVHSEGCALVVKTPVGRRHGSTSKSLRDVVDQFRLLGDHPGSPIHARLTRLVSATVANVVRPRTAALEAVRMREERLRRALPSAAKQMVQAGLFDRRAVLSRARRESAHDARLLDLDASLRSLERTANLAGRADLVAVLIVRGGRR